MKFHDPITFEAHRNRKEEHLIYIASLVGWTLAEAIERNWEMSNIEIDEGVAPPTVEEAAPKRRGRPKGTNSKPAQNANLLAAVEFVSVVKTETFEMSAYAAFRDNYIIAYSNVLAAAHPVQEQLNTCPQIEKLKAALTRTGRTMSVTEGVGGLSIKGDKLRATVPVLAEPLADVQPDMPVLTGDFDGLKAAFKAACTVADEKNDEKAMYSSVLLDPNTATATDGKVLIQYWHGYNGLPPGTVLPVVFCKTITNMKSKITGIGASWDAEKGFATSMTFWFESGAWLKTQCYEDRWQSFEQLLNQPLEYTTPVFPGLFEAIAAILPFCNESEAVFFVDDGVQTDLTDNVGASYPVKDLSGGKIFNARLLKQVAPYVTTIDIETSPDRGFFFGGTEANPVRGVFMGMAGSK